VTAPPSVISWNLTRRCGLSCPHCYIDAAGRRRGGADELSSAECLGIVDQVAEMAPGALLILTGGEPLLRHDLAEIARRAAGAGLFPVVGTSGVGLDDARLDELVAAGITGLSVSLDSVDPVPHDRFRGMRGAHRATVEAVRRSVDRGVHVVLQHSLMAFNAGELPAMVAFAAELRVAVINVFYLVCTGRGERLTRLSAEVYEASLVELAELRRRYEGRLIVGARCAPQFARVAGDRQSLLGGCPAGSSYLRIAPDGSVTPCPYLPQAVGTLREATLAELWSSETMAALRSPSLEGRCGRCEYEQSCGGCRARALAEGGDLMGEDPICTFEPTGVVVEVESVAAEPVWREDAKVMLGRIPGFIRGRVERRVIAACRERGIAVVTPELMAELKPGGLPFGRPKG
jgi:AdoMet-dependent heme synthase